MRKKLQILYCLLFASLSLFCEVGASQAGKCTVSHGEPATSAAQAPGKGNNVRLITATFKVFVTHKDESKVTRSRTETYEIVVGDGKDNESESMSNLLLRIKEDCEKVLQKECEKHKCHQDE